MRLLFIRHGEPDYELDSLTPRGKLEAEALAKIAPSLHIDHAYVSPLGRAQETASYTLNRLGMTAETLPWLEEFTARIDSALVAPETGLPELQGSFHPYYNEDGTPRKRGIWDIYPAYYCGHPEYRDPVDWTKSAITQHSDQVETLDRVWKGFDDLLAQHGYVRDDKAGVGIYRAERPNDETIAFFCHFAITSVFLSRLWGTSPFMPMQALCMAPSSVTELVTEERQEGIAVFRALRIGDISHLAMAGLQPSFYARFCELYSNKEERH